MIAILYIIAAIAQIAGGIPQVLRLLQTRQTKSMSLTTWGLWAVAQVVMTIYVASRQEWLIMWVSIGWVTLYSVIIGLIVYYRYLAPVHRTVYNSNDYAKETQSY
ncbi:MAG: PQ-loop domain-containing transporter [Candidatus Saccharibacteria bacterium]|nr:PQ-loop domain-containing transporter [Candidatus Saccharibacteria bacterium]